jgi:hypothetical protein
MRLAMIEVGVTPAKCRKLKCLEGAEYEERLQTRLNMVSGKSRLARAIHYAFVVMLWHTSTNSSLDATPFRRRSRAIRAATGRVQRMGALFLQYLRENLPQETKIADLATLRCSAKIVLRKKETWPISL